MQVGYIYDEIYLLHDTGFGHPESSERLVAIEEVLEDLKDELVLLKPIAVSQELLEMVHPFFHIQKIKDGEPINSDTVNSIDSYQSAITAVGAGVVAIDAIKNSEIDRAFCAVRPPGHHCTEDMAMGFCLFNNIAITAKYAQKQGYEKVFIIDFDVHHGNGTQDIFYEDDTVFYFSSHQTMCFPGTGMEDEIGIGEGEGFTSNHLLMPESGDEMILDIYENELQPLIDEFEPDIILVSAGYDLHESDPLASLNVTTAGIEQIVTNILNCADVPFIFMLEGGYDVNALAKNVRMTIERMMR